MTLNVFHVIAEVRRVLQDDANLDDPRNTDDEIRAAMNMALADFRRARPDIFVGQMSTLPDLVTVDTIEIEDMFLTPLVHITTAYVMMQTNEYAQDGTAANLLALARSQLARP
jgi:hypothetical protein